MATPIVTSRPETPNPTQTIETSPLSAPVDPIPKDSIESLDDKPSSSPSCLKWCMDQICHFFSAIGRFLCNLCGRSPKPSLPVSKEPQKSELDPSSTSSPRNELTDAQPSKLNPEISMPLESTSLPQKQQSTRQLPTSSDPTRSILEHPPVVSDREKVSIPTATDSAPASVPDPVVEKSKEAPLLFPGTEWANKLLEDYEEMHTKDPSKIKFGCFYAGLRDLQYCGPFFNKYTTLEQLQFVHALTNENIKPARLSIDLISLGNFVSRFRNDVYTTPDCNELYRLIYDARNSPDAMKIAIMQIHQTVENYLINRPKGV